MVQFLWSTAKPDSIRTVDIPIDGPVPIKDANGIVYFLYDKITGELLKVGSTGRPNSDGRWDPYQTWADLEAEAWGRRPDLELQYIRADNRKTAGNDEKGYRARIRDGEFGDIEMRWDYTGRPGSKPKEFGGKGPSLKDMRPPGC